MKHLVLASALVLLPGCEALRAIAPQTTAGFEANGILGALDGASGAIVARCRTASGADLRVAVDGIVALTGHGDLVARVRNARANACTTATRINAVVDGGADGDVTVTPLATDNGTSTGEGS